MKIQTDSSYIVLYILIIILIIISVFIIYNKLFTNIEGFDKQQKIDHCIANKAKYINSQKYLDEFILFYNYFYAYIQSYHNYLKILNAYNETLNKLKEKRMNIDERMNNDERKKLITDRDNFSNEAKKFYTDTFKSFINIRIFLQDYCLKKKNTLESIIDNDNSKNEISKLHLKSEFHIKDIFPPKFLINSDNISELKTKLKKLYFDVADESNQKSLFIDWLNIVGFNNNFETFSSKTILNSKPNNDTLDTFSKSKTIFNELQFFIDNHNDRIFCHNFAPTTPVNTFAPTTPLPMMKVNDIIKEIVNEIKKNKLQKLSYFIVDTMNKTSIRFPINIILNDKDNIDVKHFEMFLFFYIVFFNSDFFPDKIHAIHIYDVKNNKVTINKRNYDNLTFITTKKTMIAKSIKNILYNDNSKMKEELDVLLKKMIEFNSGKQMLGICISVVGEDVSKTLFLYIPMTNDYVNKAIFNYFTNILYKKCKKPKIGENFLRIIYFCGGDVFTIEDTIDKFIMVYTNFEQEIKIFNDEQKVKIQNYLNCNFKL